MKVPVIISPNVASVSRIRKGDKPNLFNGMVLAEIEDDLVYEWEVSDRARERARLAIKQELEDA